MPSVDEFYVALSANVAGYIAELDRAMATTVGFEEKMALLSKPVMIGGLSGVGASYAGLAGSVTKSEESLASSTSKINQHLTNTIGIGSMLKPLAAITIAGFAVSSEKSFADAGQAAFEMSSKFGLLPQQASAWLGAAHELGMGTDSVSKGMRFMARAMEEAHVAFDEHKPLPGALAVPLKDLGVTLIDQAGHFRDMNTVMMEVADKFAAMPEGPERAAIAVKLFGRAGTDMIPILDQGSAGIKKLMDSAQQAGIVMDASTVQQAHQSYLEIQKLDVAVASLSMSMGRILTPVITGLAESLTFVSAHFKELSPVIAVVTVAMTALAVRFAITGIITGLTVAISAFGVALDVALGPVGLIALAIAALTVGIYMLVTHFQQVTAFLQGPWGTAISAAVVGVFPFIGITMLLLGHWQQVLQFFRDLPGHIIGALSNLGAMLKDMATGAMSAMLDGIAAGAADVGRFFVNLPGWIVQAIGNVDHLLYDVGKRIMQSLWDGMKAIWGDMTGWISGLASWISDHKGPEAYDRALLIPHGVAMMSGFNEGLMRGFGDVQRNVAGMAPVLSVTGAASMAYATAGGPGGGVRAGVSIGVVNITVPDAGSPRATALAVRDVLLDLKRSTGVVIGLS